MHARHRSTHGHEWKRCKAYFMYSSNTSRRSCLERSSNSGSPSSLAWAFLQVVLACKPARLLQTQHALNVCAALR